MIRAFTIVFIFCWLASISGQKCTMHSSLPPPSFTFGKICKENKKCENVCETGSTEVCSVVNSYTCTSYRRMECQNVPSCSTRSPRSKRSLIKTMMASKKKLIGKIFKGLFPKRGRHLGQKRPGSPPNTKVPPSSTLPKYETPVGPPATRTRGKWNDDGKRAKGVNQNAIKENQQSQRGQQSISGQPSYRGQSLSPKGRPSYRGQQSQIPQPSYKNQQSQGNQRRPVKAHKHNHLLDPSIPDFDLPQAPPYSYSYQDEANAGLEHTQYSHKPSYNQPSYGNNDQNCGTRRECSYVPYKHSCGLKPYRKCRLEPNKKCSNRCLSSIYTCCEIEIPTITTTTPQPAIAPPAPPISGIAPPAPPSSIDTVVGPPAPDSSFQSYYYDDVDYYDVGLQEYDDDFVIVEA